MLKSHSCGELRLADAGHDVTLAGWVHRRRDHGGLIFIDLRDRYGLTQVVFNPAESGAAHAVAEGLRNEYVLQVRGPVERRPEGTLNPQLPDPHALPRRGPARRPPAPVHPARPRDELGRRE